MSLRWASHGGRFRSGLFAGAIGLLLLHSEAVRGQPAAALIHTRAQAEVGQEIRTAMSGAWTGVLEYRDYQTDGRVELPTWLKITSDGDGLRFEYVYDDGPTKVVTDSERVVIDAAQQTYRVTSKTGEAGEVASVSGLAALRSGRGTLTLTGTGVENDHAVEVRTTLKIGRNLLEILRETHLPGEEFKFRHRYVFTRAVAPSVASAATR